MRKTCDTWAINVTSASFRASFYNYVLTFFCSGVEEQHINVESCSKHAQASYPCVTSFTLLVLPGWHGGRVD